MLQKQQQFKPGKSPGYSDLTELSPKTTSHYLFCAGMKQLFIAIAITCLIASCKDVKDPELVGIENVSMKKMDMKASVVTLQVKYFNPNHFNAKLKEAEGDAWMDSTFLGHFRMDSLIQVPAHSEFLVPVDLSVDMKYLLQHSMSAFLNDEVLIKIKGTAKAGRNGFYRNFVLNYEGKQNLGKLFKQ